MHSPCVHTQVNVTLVDYSGPGTLAPLVYRQAEMDAVRRKAEKKAADEAAAAEAIRVAEEKAKRRKERKVRI